METSWWRKGYRENQNGEDMCVSINFQYFVAKMSFWTFVMCQVETTKTLDGKFSGGLINVCKF